VQKALYSISRSSPCAVMVHAAVRAHPVALAMHGGVRMQHKLSAPPGVSACVSFCYVARFYVMQ
jgi:hypothetical protein